jgi:dopamine beta-monooxygenase
VGRSPSSISIPPGKSNYEVIGECASDCTSQIWPGGVSMKFLRNLASGITVFAVHGHTHSAGNSFKTQIIRNGTELEPLTQIDNYDFNFQLTQYVEPVQLSPGDRLVTHCTYDTTSRTTTTLGGQSILSENCFNYLTYYPK